MMRVVGVQTARGIGVSLLVSVNTMICRETLVLGHRSLLVDPREERDNNRTRAVFLRCCANGLYLASDAAAYVCGI